MCQTVKTWFLEKDGFSHLDEITNSSRISVTVSMIILKIKNKLETLFKEIDVKTYKSESYECLCWGFVCVDSKITLF